ncbi:MAG TPA: NADPH:quinone oxidoreductase family protein [Dehalococcoidia bacterium]
MASDTMRALVLRSLEGGAGLEIQQVPAPGGADDVIIEVHAAGIGFPDLLMTKGQYQFKPNPPFIPGVEAAGVVLRAPASSDVKPGDRVIASSRLGAWAEIAAAHPLSAMPIPDGMTFEEATAMVNYQTAYFGLVWRGRIQPGETVLVHGAAGGTGTAAIQVARGLGATVIAIARGDEKLAIARDCGAQHCIEAESEWLSEVRRITNNGGVDIVYDPVGGDRFTDSVRSLAPLGRVLVIGFTGGAIPEVKVNRLLLRNTAVIGVAWGEYVRVDPTMPRTIAASLAELHTAGHIRPPIGGVYTMDQCADALRALEERRATGKLVLKVR